MNAFDFLIQPGCWAEGYLTLGEQGGKTVIAKAEYKVRKTLPGKNEYDYEEISLTSIQDEANPKTGEELLAEIMRICRGATAAAAAARKAKQQ